MTPPTVEYWRVWSDSRSEYLEREWLQVWADPHLSNAELRAKHACAVSDELGEVADWRPVRVRETVVEE